MERNLSTIPIKVGLHYHIPIYVDKKGKLKTPSYFGLFIDSLAKNCEVLYCLLFSAQDTEIQQCDYSIASENIVWINIGAHVSIPKRYLTLIKIIKIFKQVLRKVDILLIRTPTPFIPLIVSIASKKKLAIYVVGDYDVSKMLSVNNPKKILIQLLFKLMSLSERKFAKKNGLVLANSRNLLNSFNQLTNNVLEIRSTSISRTDFFYREDTCDKPTIHLLYTGRLDPIKNLPLIFRAIQSLSKEGVPIIFNMAYLFDTYSLKYLDFLKKEAQKLNISDKVIFHGQKRIGEDLNKVYRSCDIYIIASSTEGFPRGIWDAMANGLPVIASTVGSVPFYLEHKKDAVLIPPENLKGIIEALKLIIENKKLRKRLIKNGYILAGNNTLETQGFKMINALNQYIKTKD